MIEKLKKQIQDSSNEAAKALFYLLEKDERELQIIEKEIERQGGVSKVMPKNPFYIIKKDLDARISDRMAKISRMMEKENTNEIDPIGDWMKKNQKGLESR